MMNTHSQTVGRLRERLREETAAVILGAAEAVIAEVGLHGARMEEIAARAGVSVGTVYNHFEDRNALVQALFLSRASRLHDLLEEGRSDVEGLPARDQVRGILKAVRLHAREHGRFFTALMGEHQGPSALRPPTAARAHMSKRIDEVIAHGISSGEFREDPLGIFGDALQALARLVLARTLEGKADDAELEALTELFVRGVAR
jgi:AcrR family transcriptional regulator